MIEGTADQRRHGATYFIPFNDAQWTTPGAGYAIGLRRDRDYYFVDDNNAVGYLGATVSGGQYQGARTLDFSVANAAGGSGRPRWTVRVQRPSLAP